MDTKKQSHWLGMRNLRGGKRKNRKEKGKLIIMVANNGDNEPLTLLLID